MEKAREQSPASPFLLTAEQHLELAEEFRSLGRPDLARNHELVAKLIEARSAKH